MTNVIQETLISKYGPVLSIVQLAAVLDRSPEGLRISLTTKSDWSEKLNAARLKIGRRVYFRTAEIAAFLSGN